MTKIINSKKSFHLKVKTLYDIEKQLENALPKMAEAATDPELKDGFTTHLEETQMHSERLEQIFQLIDAEPERHASAGIKGIIEEGKTIIDADAPSAIKDAMLAGAARSAEHFEMACYLTAIEEAKGLEYDDVVALLTETLEEEEATDEKLSVAQANNLTLAKDLEDDEA